ncbi:hypothetical protein I316_03502 [Kwoniella heveanensis BCC8398]|uniref:Uncharacterized protein n=1 Tax=Kwoniella heveanensis BCC8398 TaxID=1296120 RepID=A0A1B9GVL7_9TREE|nr:hypothetical protein I316_03502 [Kwoniella heveanensis BCC8398]
MLPRNSIPYTVSGDLRSHPIVLGTSAILELDLDLEPSSIRALRHTASSLSAKALTLSTSAGETAFRLSQEAARVGGEALRHHGTELLSAACATVQSYTAKSISPRSQKPIIDLSNPDEGYLYLLERAADAQPFHTVASAVRGNRSSRGARAGDSNESKIQGRRHQQFSEGMIEWKPRFLDTNDVHYTEISNRMRYTYYGLPRPLKEAACSCGTEMLVVGDRAASSLLKSEQGYWIGTLNGERVYTRSGCGKGSVVFPKILDPIAPEKASDVGTGTGHVSAFGDEYSDSTAGSPTLGVLSDDEWGADIESENDSQHQRFMSDRDSIADHKGGGSLLPTDALADRSSYEPRHEGADGWTSWSPARLPENMGVELRERSRWPSPALQTHDALSTLPVLACVTGEEVSSTNQQPSTGEDRGRKGEGVTTATPANPQRSGRKFSDGFSDDAENFLLGSHEPVVRTAKPMKYDKSHDFSPSSDQHISPDSSSRPVSTQIRGEPAQKLGNRRRPPRWTIHPYPSDGATTTKGPPLGGSIGPSDRSGASGSTTRGSAVPTSQTSMPR